MLRKKKMQLKSEQNINRGGFNSNTPGIQSRRVIEPFINQEQKDGNNRDLDDFHRQEGYQPSTPRQLGVPNTNTGNQLSETQDLEVFSLPNQTNSKEASTKRSRWFLRRHKKD